MLILCALLIAWMMALAGLGRVTRFVAWPASRATGFVPADPLIGLLLAGTGATVANFFVPLSSSAGLAVMAAGILCALTGFARGLSPLKARALAPHLAFVVVTAAFLTHRAGYLDDVGAYQLPATLWSIAGPIPAGLANLNPRLGFNSEWFVLDALTRVKFVGAGPTLVTALGAWMLAASLWWLSGREGARPVARAFLFLVPLVLLSPALQVGFNAPATDAPVLIAWLGVGAVVVAHETGAISLRAATVLSTVLALLGIVVKLSAFPMMLVPALLLWRARDARLAIQLTIVSIAVALPWVARGVWTSGCAAFPMAATCLKVPWSVEPAWIAGEALNVRNWALLPYWTPEALAAGGWFGDWAVRQVSSVEFLGPLSIAAVAVLAPRGALPMRVGANALAWATAAQVLFIGASAPDIRFAAGALWSLAIVFAAPRFGGEPAPTGIRRLAPLAPVALLAPFIVSAATHYSRGIRHVNDEPRAWLTPPVIATEVPHRTRVIEGNVRINTPIIGITCWATPMPCTPPGWVHPRLTVEHDAQGRISKFARAGQ